MYGGKLVRNITKNYVQIQCHVAPKESLAFVVSSFDFESWEIIYTEAHQPTFTKQRSKDISNVLSNSASLRLQQMQLLQLP